MKAIILTQASIALFALVAMFLIHGKRVLVAKSLVSLFFLVYFADNLLMVLTERYSGLQAIRSHVWEGFLICNWSGKLYSILFALALLYLFRTRLTRDDVGLTFRQKEGSLLPSVVVVAALGAWAYFVGISSPKGQLDVEVLAYLAIMPGLNEELIYRGVLLGILDKVTPGNLRFLEAPVGWGIVITSLLFALLHGFWFDSSLAIHVNGIALRNSLISGFIFAWLRARTGSLVMPIIAHGVEDFLFFLPRMA